MSDHVARLHGVSAGYRGSEGYRAVLEGVDLELSRGDVLALLGANGSGKTTLLGILAGTIRPTAGRIELLGRPIEGWSRAEIARSVTVLPQSIELPAGFRVAEVVALGRIPHARSMFAVELDDERAVADALADAGAADLADRLVGELSGGERQRVLVAMALAQEPRLLLLDEPTLHLDLAHQLALVDLLGRLRGLRELTVVGVLHDLNLAHRLADRIVLLDRGNLLAAGGGSRPLDLALARRAFGVPVAEAHTADGSRVLAVGHDGRTPARPRR